ncbi:MAG: L,D-transpeptidase family protein [Thiohalocapsa sp.]
MVRLVALLALAGAFLGGFVAAVRGGWLGGAIGVDGAALARLEAPALGGRLDWVRVEDARGRPVAVRLVGDQLWPRRRLPQAVRLSIEARFSRPGLLGLLFGGGRVSHLALLTPQAQVSGRLFRFRSGEPVMFGFSEPVQVVDLRISGRRWRRVFAASRAAVAAGVSARGRDAAGEAVVAAAPRRWEQLSLPVRVRWFPPGSDAMVAAAPLLGGSLRPWQELRLVFSQSLSTLFGRRLPRLSPKVQGEWRRLDADTLVFEPGPRGFPLAATITIALPAPVQPATGATTTPARLLRWQVVSGSLLRLQQLLAQLGYLPLDWQPADAVADASPAAQIRAAMHPPAGSFGWRYANTPEQLSALWQPGRPNLLTSAAILAFQSQHGLHQDGSADADLWQALLADAATGTPTSSNGYSYILISRAIPQTLSLWHNGQTIIRSRVNAGTLQNPIQPGSYPIRQRYARQTASGAGQPNRWINYFHGSDSLHSSTRRSYGRPDSSDGIELPAPIAYRLWPYTGVGTLVTITR